MDESIRTATVNEQPQIVACVEAAYSKYLERMSKPPAPMLTDYAPLLAAGTVHVVGDPIAGVVVLTERDGALLVDDLAVHPEHQGRGLGRALMKHAENEGARRSLGQIGLFTNEAMTENIAFYCALGYQEVDRRTQDGYRRVYFQKNLGAAGSD